MLVGERDVEETKSIVGTKVIAIVPIRKLVSELVMAPQIERWCPVALTEGFRTRYPVPHPAIAYFFGVAESIFVDKSAVEKGLIFIFD